MSLPVESGKGVQKFQHFLEKNRIFETVPRIFSFNIINNSMITLKDILDTLNFSHSD